MNDHHTQMDCVARRIPFFARFRFFPRRDDSADIIHARNQQLCRITLLTLHAAHPYGCADSIILHVAHSVYTDARLEEVHNSLDQLVIERKVSVNKSNEDRWLCALIECPFAVKV
ncbi:MAG: hypothetical protein LBV45_01110 [Xanthomonadaceae bacterium]|jgi:hypothetical protein|nr:hypothetical protein [Xanthomonadaceae bacterium]